MKSISFYRIVFLFVALWLGFTPAASSVSAQQATMSYQGYLTDLNGEALDGPVALTFRLYDAALGGAMLWEESQTNVPLSDGVFSVMLGSRTDLDGVAFDGPRYLSVSVDGGDALAPRVALGTAPMSLYARSVADGAAVRSINGMADEVTLEGGDNVTITETDGTLTIDAVAGGSFALPFEGENTTNETAMKITNTGTLFGLDVSSTGVGALTAQGLGDATALFAFAEGINAALSARTSGTGTVATFTQDNIASTNPALLATTNGEGPAGLFRNTSSELVDATLKVESEEALYGVHSIVNGTCCIAGFFEVDNPQHSGAAITAMKRGFGDAVHVEARDESSGVASYSHGIGKAGIFAIQNPASATDALEAYSFGSGDAFYAYQGNNATGRAAHFEHKNASSSTPTVLVTANSDVLATPALHVTHTGRGTAGRFEVTGTNGPGNALYAVSQGPGVAIHGATQGTGALAVGVWANAANGSNAVPLRVSQDGTGNDIAVFQATTGVNQARIDRTGKGFFNGGTQNSGADIAEAFEVEGSVAAYEPGDVLVISTRTDRTVEKSDAAYSTRVVGVYATKPGVLLTERGIDETLEDTVPMGVVGVIPTKVSGENGPIRRGDLLVTSATPGHAMKADPEALRVGAVLGKALENFDGAGTGLIKVLVNAK